MGLNDNVYTISKTLISDKQEKAKAREGKEYLQHLQAEFRHFLLQELIYSKNQNENIYIDDFKDYIIGKVVFDYVDSLSAERQKRFNKQYRHDVISFMLLNYYKTCGQAERIAKKQNAEAEDYKKQIAIEKWQLQKKKMELQLEKEKQKNNREVQQQKQETINIILMVLKVLLAPFALIRHNSVTVL